MNELDIIADARDAVLIISAFPSNFGEVDGKITDKGARVIDSALGDIRLALDLLEGKVHKPNESN